MDAELFDLCKEVHERTGWETENRLEDYEKVEWKENVKFRKILDLPLYTSDYLLEKLPIKMGDEYATYLTLDIDFEKEWTAHYSDGTGVSSIYIGSASTPLKALLKLTIALDEAKELK